MMGMLYRRTESRTVLEVEPRISIEGETILREEWKAVYLEGKKAGFCYSSIKKGDGEQYRLESILCLRAKGGDTDLTMDIHGDTCLNKDLTLQAFNLNLTSNLLEGWVKGEVTGEKMKIDFGLSGENPSQLTIKFREAPNLSDMLNLIVLKRGLKVGKLYRVKTFDILTMSSVISTIEVLRKERLRWADTEEEAYVVRRDCAGVTTYGWLNKKGEVLKEVMEISGMKVEMHKVGRNEGEELSRGWRLFPPVAIELEPAQLEGIKKLIKLVRGKAPHK